MLMVVLVKRKDVLEISLSLVGIAVIAVLEWQALQKGIDGVALTVAVAAIALLCPSPTKWLIKVKDALIEKGKSGSDAPRE